MTKESNTIQHESYRIMAHCGDKVKPNPRR
jgi:hypothetical protein